MYKPHSLYESSSFCIWYAHWKLSKCQKGWWYPHSPVRVTSSQNFSIHNVSQYSLCILKFSPLFNLTDEFSDFDHFDRHLKRFRSGLSQTMKDGVIDDIRHMLFRLLKSVCNSGTMIQANFKRDSFSKQYNSEFEIPDSHRLNWPITIRLCVMWYTNLYCDSSIQTMQTKDFEPWYKYNFRFRKLELKEIRLYRTENRSPSTWKWNKSRFQAFRMPN